jgi:hypothetical protein
MKSTGRFVGQVGRPCRAYRVHAVFVPRTLTSSTLTSSTLTSSTRAGVRNYSMWNRHSKNIKNISKHEDKYMSKFMKLMKIRNARRVFVGLVVCAMGYIIYAITDWFSSITFKHITRWSFMAGSMSTTMIFAILYLLRRHSFIRSERLFKQAIDKVSYNSQVVSKVGKYAEPSKFKPTTRICPDIVRDNEYLNFDEASYPRQWDIRKPVHTQFMIGYNGSQTAMISGEVSKEPGVRGVIKNNIVFHNLRVDFEDGESIILEGDNDFEIYKGTVVLR